MINKLKSILGMSKPVQHQDEVNNYLLSNKLKSGLINNIKILQYN